LPASLLCWPPKQKRPDTTNKGPIALRLRVWATILSYFRSLKPHPMPQDSGARLKAKRKATLKLMKRAASGATKAPGKGKKAAAKKA
jgi:hypothetical protein